MFLRLDLKMDMRGVPVQWVKNLTAVAWVALEARVQSLAQHSALKDLALQLRFHPWPRELPYAMGAAL